MKFIVGVDADGVLTDLSSFYIRNGRKFFKKEPTNVSGYSVKDIFGVTEKQEFKFGLVSFPKYISKEEPREKCVETLQELMKDPEISLHEITARKFVTGNNPLGSYSRKGFEKWLKKYGLVFDSIEYCSESNTPRDKYISCLKLSVDVMIEDKTDVALFLAEQGIKILLFDAPYNQQLNHPNITRVHSWDEISNIIKERKSHKKDRKEFKKLTKDEKLSLSPEEKVEYFDSYKTYLKNLQINEEALRRNATRYHRLYRLIKLPMFLGFKIKIKGKENIPYQKGIIFASNHLNSYDQFYICKMLGNRQIYGLASTTVIGTPRGRLFDMTKSVIYVDREDKESREMSEEELAKMLINGKDILIFPEGTRKNKTEEGRKMLQLPFKYGTVSLAQKTGAAIVPISIYYGEEKYLKVGDIKFVLPGDDLTEANKDLEETIKSLTLQSMEEDKSIKKKRIIRK